MATVLIKPLNQGLPNEKLGISIINHSILTIINHHYPSWTYGGWLRNPAPVKNGGKQPIIHRVSTILLVVQDFFHHGRSSLPVVPHKAVAEVSKIGNL